MATAQDGCTTKPPDARRNGRTQELRDSSSRAIMGCTEVAVLVKEVSGLKQMMEDLKETVAGLQLDDKGAETGSRVTTTGVSQDRE